MFGVPTTSAGMSNTPLDAAAPSDPINASKGPAKKGAKKGESRHQQWWYPKRCELPGCEVRDEGLLKCGACSMVMYCCKEHQRLDWPTHKADCAVFKRIGARATFYTDEEMLARYPLQPKGKGARINSHAAVPAGSCCQLCLKTTDQVNMNRTTCCGEVVCGNSQEYELFSYSREFCQRSHDRYTLCGYHGVERECAQGVDWRVCPACTGRGGGTNTERETSDRLWRGLNPYNYCPLLERDVPRHALCETCDACGNKFIGGAEGSSYGPAGSTCLRCS